MEKTNTAKVWQEEAQPFLFPGDEHGVLLLHGFTGTCSHMRPIGEYLRDCGFTVRGINLPGHASSMEDMARFGWRDWLKAAVQAFDELNASCRSVSVCGWSMGGDLALILAETKPVTAVVPISAPVSSFDRKLRWGKPLSLLKLVTLWEYGPERAAQQDPRYDLEYEGYPTRCGAELDKLIRMAERDLSKITCPILAVHSRKDEFISPENAQIIMDHVSSPMKHILWLQDAPHACTISNEWKTIASGIVKTLREAETVRPYNE